jgi:hypothetical protein
MIFVVGLCDHLHGGYKDNILVQHLRLAFLHMLDCLDQL